MALSPQIFNLPQRQKIDYGQLGGMVAQGINPQAQILAQVLPTLMAEKYKSHLEQQRQRELVDGLVQGGNGPTGDFKISVGPSGITYSQKSAKEKLEDVQAQRRLGGGIPSAIPQATQPTGQGGAVPTKWDEFGIPTEYGEPKGLPAESAGKLTMIQQALTDLDQAEKLLFTKEGKFLSGRAAGANIPGGRVPVLGRLIPDVGYGAKNRQLASAMNNALEAKLRIETGAAATQEEFNRIQDRFGITAFDNAESARNKIKRLREFMKNAAITVDPSGKFVYTTGNNKMDFKLNTDIPEGWEVVE